MQLMCHPLGVLGSRHGIMFNPVDRNCGVIRYDRFDEMPTARIRAGVVVDGTEYVFPLCPDGESFACLDQRLSTCTVSWRGIHPASAIKVRLTATTPFRPRDAEFSTTPVLHFRLEAERLSGQFRWEAPHLDVPEAELFFEAGGPDMAVEPVGDDAADIRFTSRRFPKTRTPDEPIDPMVFTFEEIPQRDRLVGLTGERAGIRFRRTVRPADPTPEPLDVAWCAWDEPRFDIHGTKHPFKYAERFDSLDAVADHVRAAPTALVENAERVDRIVAENDCSAAVNRLLSQTLHTWMNCCWWVTRDGRDWYSVWEGSCYLMSTVDVEYTQAPFYLAVWPELLAVELGFWTDYSKDGTLCLGDAGAETLFLSHDCGWGAEVRGQAYHHEMEIEETTNYVILLYAHWRRTGDDTLVREKIDFVRKYLAFCAAADTTGSGVADKGVSNTVDDASPAVQFGRDQVYLAVKTLAAYRTGAEMLEHAGDADGAEHYRALAETTRAAVAETGWKEDHFVTLLDPSAEGVIDPWTGEPLDADETPGWDCAHIYTANGLAVLDMVGFESGVDEARLRTDLRVATARCMKEYGCAHSEYFKQAVAETAASGVTVEGLVGASKSPGWIAMNMLRDVAAFYRGVDLRALADRYWEWQTTVNCREPRGYFETFSGNNLWFYPRGLAAWGWFDALGGVVVDRVSGTDRADPVFGGVRVPRLLDADWTAGTVDVVEHHG